MSNPIGPLRWYAVLAVLFFGILPAVLVALLVAGGNTPWQVGLLLVGGVPLVLCAIILVVRGFRAAEPELAEALLKRGMAFVAGADVLMLGGNALIRMATGA
ncbi:hypothetical protein Aph02nite_26000 [Actinoplanes philippinensis]|uniref:Uncharacterized protein n=1 Tax=Actinoplanes philippinensis TaxID=35752 RepID=A0A1I2G7B8_9ACTN|nr:hypothetical protein [Actinoplanes philippinensis]GIE76650.1 hypothetical protein Aph02nite_26000 [Actinoplanes philippinensis]SFF13049.1 hypothetical protein SAMN05421541_106258 [Actinoplanes philippinensis]